MKISNLPIVFGVLSLLSLTFSPGAYAHEQRSDGDNCMRMSKTGNADVDFIRSMIPHHQMALDMAEKELKNGRDPAAREMAQKIIVAQEREISTMKKWLNTHQP